MFRYLILLCPFILTTACGCQAVAPQDILIGLSMDEVEAQLGRPDTTFQHDEPYFGARPSSLAQGDAYTSVSYNNHQGEQLNLFLVAPEVYERIKGVRPGEESLYVVEVVTLPLNTVF